MVAHPQIADAPRAGFWPGFFAALTGRSIAWAIVLAALVTLAIAPVFLRPILFGRALFIAIVLLLAFAAAGQWRQSLLPRWVVQLLAVALAAPGATLAVYLLSTGGDMWALFGNEARVTGLITIGGSALVLGLVLALGALYRERDAQADAQALQFALERETLQRQAADAQLKVLQSQIEPHFLFNTLANVQALVESGSPRAGPVLGSLIVYLRAALPQLHRGAPTLDQEAALVRSYLELMQMRMPDRLAFAIDVDPSLRGLRLPPLTLLTLVENTVRHGIDPSEAGGRIAVGARRDVASGAIRLWVADSGRGIDESQTPGTGLANLRERLAATYGADASLSLHALSPHGMCAEITLPADPR
jgi:Histidine kinase